MRTFSHIAIAGAGPIGSLLAVLFRLNGLDVTLYEKRERATRTINLHASAGLTETAQACNPGDDLVFDELNEDLEQNHHAILINELENRLRQKARDLGVNYRQQEIASFDALQALHSHDTLLIDAAGRRSPLRLTQFGGEDNEEVHDVDHVLYLSISDSSGRRIQPSFTLYSIMKHVPGIKLLKLLKSKPTADGAMQITIAMTISSELADLIAGTNPYHPFRDVTEMDPAVHYAISAALVPLILAGAQLDLNTLSMNKISTQTGYAKNRSRGNRISVGDSAGFLVYFRSFNVGWMHACDLVNTVLSCQDTPELWEERLNEFEARREDSFRAGVAGNLSQKQLYQLMATSIAINGASPIKLTETVQWLFFKNAIYPAHFRLFYRMFEEARLYFIDPDKSLLSTIRSLILLLNSSYYWHPGISVERAVKQKSLDDLLRFVEELAGEHLSHEENCAQINAFLEEHSRIIHYNSSSGVQYKYLFILIMNLLKTPKQVPQNIHDAAGATTTTTTTTTTSSALF